MSISEFKFSNPKLIHLNFQINNDYSKNEDPEIEMNISISPNVNKISDTEAIVDLTIEIGEPSNQSPIFINLTVGAKFKLDSRIEESDFDKLLEVNAPALLLSYARPIISSVSGQAGIAPINLPFINFTQ